MAQAPTPGGNKPASTFFRITVRGRTLEFANNISMQEKMAIRLATGLPFDAFWAGENRIGEDSLCVLWWLARRANGEPNLAWAQHVGEWPSDLAADEVDMDIIDDTEESDDPEG